MTIDLDLEDPIPCPECGGLGEDEDGGPCPECDGQGEIAP